VQRLKAKPKAEKANKLKNEVINSINQNTSCDNQNWKTACFSNICVHWNF